MPAGTARERHPSAVDPRHVDLPPAPDRCASMDTFRVAIRDRGVRFSCHGCTGLCRPACLHNSAATTARERLIAEAWLGRARVEHAPLDGLPGTHVAWRPDYACVGDR